MSGDILTTLADQVIGQVKSTRDQAREAGWDTWLLLIVCVLIGFGLVMLYSASAVMASQRMGHHFVLVANQLQKLAVGFVLLVFGLKFDYRWYKKFIYPIFALALVLLLLVAIPHIGTMQNGARRWFSLFGFSFQPAEVAKIAAIMYLSYSVSKKGDRMVSFSVGFIPHLMMVGLMVGLLMLQPDFGSSVILLSLMMMYLFVSGAKVVYLTLMSLIGVFGAYIVISGSTYRMNRVMAYLDPWSYRSNIGYQISESLIAIGSGGMGGKGLGNGTGKLGYVPELWNDFIGTIVAEELGLLGVVVLVGLFIALLWRGMRVAFGAKDEFGKYLAFGITALFGFQATANLCVVTGLLPNKGLTLPFVSFGGSSLIMSMFATGILLNISKSRAADAWAHEDEARSQHKAAKRWEKRRSKILSRRADLRQKFE